MTKKIGRSVLTVLLAFVMVFETLVPCLSAFAASTYTYEGGVGTKVSDLDTSTKYSESLGDNASTEFSGRVWTDKSVYTDDVTFATYGGGTSTVKLNENLNGEDFLVAFSALATSESIEGQTQAPVDVVLILDISGSMSNAESNMDNNKSRIYNTVQAANAAIDELMSLNPYTRVAVVAFSTNARVLLPLDRYTKTTRLVEIEQPGPNRWENQEVEYFTLNRETGSNNYATLYTNAVNSSNQTVTLNTSVEGGTNIQVGLYEGMKILADENETTVDINGATVQRVPSVIILSDGSPTYSSSSSSWWAPADNANDGPGSAPYAGNGMKAILVGSYMKDAINRNYNVADTSFATTVYSVGMGISELSDNEKNLAYMTLDPGTYWNNNSVSNSMKTTIKDYWSSYTANGNTGTLNINVGQMTSSFGRWVYADKNFALGHPNTGYDVDPADGYDYVDDYYDADNASAVIDVFNEIVSSISVSAPQVPTEIKGADPMTDGYITFTDPIGHYMEVKDVKAIIYAGHTFTAKNMTTSGNKTTYIFSGSIHSAVYGDQEIKNIVITVETNADGNQILVIKIPASVIPLRVNEVLLNADGSVKTHTNNGAFPARVVYSVGLQSSVTKKADDGTVYIDKTKLSAGYLNANTNADGTIRFYSNVYTNSYTVNGSTAGDALVEFEPSHTNKFYYILQDTPIYLDADFTQQAPSTGNLDVDLADNTVYYYKDLHYHGASVESTAIERTGAQLKRTTIKVGSDGKLYRQADTPRLNRILKFEGTKTYNQTKTAEDFYAPEFHYAPGSTSAYDGKFIVHLGNNGVLTAAAGGDLSISKSVNTTGGATAPDKSFVFNLDLNGALQGGKTYDYAVVNENQSTVRTGTVSASNASIHLKAGETATIYALPPGTQYVVTEQAEPGFVQQSQGNTGTISAGRTSIASFTNTYSVTSVLFPTNGSLAGTKELVGRDWLSGDSFNFIISPYNNAPLPEGYDAENGVVVTSPDVVGGNTATFDFGQIRFTNPGVYRYTIYENEPDNNAYLPGMTYSRSLYRLVVTVVDDGSGTLKVESSDIQKLYDDNATPLFSYNANQEIVLNPGQEAEDAVVFVNKYSVDDVKRVPVALKAYTDNSGENPLVSGMFKFQLKAIGIVENGQVVDTDTSKVPMPSNSDVFVTENEGHNITFPAVSFSQQALNALGKSKITYRYEMSEVIPQNRVQGMVYDDTVYTIDVEVSIDGSHILNVNAIYPGQEEVVTFHNTYTPLSAKTDINGSKVLTGRNMKPGESFRFVLESLDTTGNVVIPAGANIATVTGALEGVASPFAFEEIEFKKAGTYLFKVYEDPNQTTSPSVQYDGQVITVTVVVEDTGTDGQLDVKSVSYGNSGNAATFTNKYSSSFNGSPVTIEGVKKLTGKSLLEGEFYFEVVEHFNGTFVSRNYVTHSADSVGTNGVYSGRIVFVENARYDKAGLYEYFITEQIPTPSVHGTTYDQAQFRATVVVTDDQNGNLVASNPVFEVVDPASQTFVPANGIVFSNTYTPTPTVNTLPLINKVIDGDRNDGLKADEFEFELKLVSANPADGIILPPATKNNRVIVSNAANGNVIFGDMTFTKAGTYVVSVEELIPQDAEKVPGITYSTQVITAVYEVVDDRNGNLTATLSYFIGGDSIINRYVATPADAEIEIKKNFTGRQNDGWLSTDSFRFEIKASDEETKNAIANGAVEIALDHGSENTATLQTRVKGEVLSKSIRVNKPGTYKFTVREINEGIPGIVYDDQPRDVVIEATDDSVNAKILVKINGLATSKASISFNNTYSPAKTDPVSFTAMKKVTASAGNRYLFKGGEFSFVLEAAPGTPMPQNTRVTNDRNGDVNFGSVQFTEVGRYSYTIREVQENLKGFSYDGEVYTVTVDVTDDVATGKLVATTKITDKTGADSELVFNNGYDPAKTTAIIFGSKELQGGHKNLTADEFEFVLKAVTENTPMPSQTTVKNTASGIFQFDAISFSKIGTYKYEVSEKNLGKTGYSYDTTVFAVTVTVTDEGSGELKATVEGVGTVDEPVIKFINKYAPKPVEVIIGANGELQKELNGRELKENEFVFALLDDGKTEIATAKNNQDGKFTFSLNFSKAGTYRYTLVERDNKVAGITYDESIYDVEIVITDKDGVLVSSDLTLSSDGNKKEQIVFKNTFTDPVPVPTDRPQTGDDSNAILWLTLLVVSGCGMIATPLWSKKKKKAEADR